MFGAVLTRRLALIVRALSAYEMFLITPLMGSAGLCEVAAGSVRRKTLRNDSTSHKQNNYLLYWSPNLLLRRPFYNGTQNHRPFKIS